MKNITRHEGRIRISRLVRAGFVPKIVSAWRALPAQYFNVIAAWNDRRPAPSILARASFKEFRKQRMKLASEEDRLFYGKTINTTQG